MSAASDVVERLARIEEKLDTALKVQADHEARLRLTDKWRYSLSAGTLVSFLTAVAGIARVAAKA